MKKYKGWSKLFAGMLILVGIMSCENKPSFFDRSPEELLEIISVSGNEVSPQEARQWLAEPAASRQFIDLRPPAVFELGHLDGAINLPAQDLFEPENLALFGSEEIEFILYGEDEHQANGPWLLLQQMGFGNVKVLQGGYSYFAGGEGAMDKFLAEQPAFDYAVEFAAAVARNKKEEEATKPPPPPPPKKIVPKPKKKKVEEEEGC